MEKLILFLCEMRSNFFFIPSHVRAHIFMTIIFNSFNFYQHTHCRLFCVHNFSFIYTAREAVKWKEKKKMKSTFHSCSLVENNGVWLLPPPFLLVLSVAVGAVLLLNSFAFETVKSNILSNMQQCSLGNMKPRK